MVTLRKQLKYDPGEDKVYIRYGPNDEWIEGTLADREEYQRSIFDSLSSGRIDFFADESIRSRFAPWDD